MSELERIYTVPLKEAWNAQRYRPSLLASSNATE